MQQTIVPAGAKYGKTAQLQFLRFLAFLNIFFHHVEVFVTTDYQLINNARFAVSFFFCLSGFLSGYSLYGREISLKLRDIGRYMGKKIRKIYPLYALAILYAALRSPIIPGLLAGDFADVQPRLVQLARNLLMIQSWFTSGYFSLNGVSWFVCTLMFLNLLTLPAAWLLNRIREKKGILAGLLAGVLAASVLFCWSTREWGNLNYLHYIFPPARCGEYFAAMLLGVLMRGIDLDRIKGSSAGFTVLEVFSFLLCWLALQIPGPEWTVNTLRWTVPLLVLLGVFTLGRGKLSELFRRPALAFWGDLAFEFFIIHHLILIEFSDLFLAFGMEVPPYAWLALPGLITTILLSLAIHYGPGWWKNRK